MSNSSKKSRREILVLGVISAKKGERLLTEWANVQEQSEPVEVPGYTITRDLGEFRRLLQRYPEIFPGDLADYATYKCNWGTARGVRRFLRRAWDAPDLRHREWYLFHAEQAFRVGSIITEDLLRKAAEAGMSPSDFQLARARDEELVEDDIMSELGRQQLEMEEPPLRPNLLEAAIFHFRHSDKALHCPNPDCPAPYFFASKKGQKYCSESCALPSQRAAKRRWWSEHKAKGGK